MQKAAAAYAYSSEEPKTEQLGSDQSVAAVATTHDKTVLHESLSHVFMVNLFSIVFFFKFFVFRKKRSGVLGCSNRCDEGALW